VTCAHAVSCEAHPPSSARPNVAVANLHVPRPIFFRTRLSALSRDVSTRDACVLQELPTVGPRQPPLAHARARNLSSLFLLSKSAGLVHAPPTISCRRTLHLHSRLAPIAGSQNLCGVRPKGELWPSKYGLCRGFSCCARLEISPKDVVNHLSICPHHALHHALHHSRAILNPSHAHLPSTSQPPPPHLAASWACAGCFPLTVDEPLAGGLRSLLFVGSAVARAACCA